MRHINKSAAGIVWITLVCLLAVSCGKKWDTFNAQDRSHRSVYYWKTTFDISAEDSLFLHEHSINRIYLRMFDVDVEYNPSKDSQAAVPIATTKFRSARPDSIEIVPTVFITLDALRFHEDSEDKFAALIVKRVLNMCSYNDLGPISEIQFDCDWTETTKAMYDNLCTSAGKILHEQGIALSGTIRLHQVEQAEYPFDRGVLMLYNTGAIKDPETDNSIISYRDVRKYLGVESRIKKFNKARKDNCPVIDFAYPTFCWGVAFERDGSFDGIIPVLDFESLPELQKVKDGVFKVTEYCHFGKDYKGIWLTKGQTVRAEYSDFSEVMKVKELVESALGTSGSNIIYHLDSKNLSRYESDEIEKILR